VSEPVVAPDVTVTFTANEAQALLALCDIAVKAAGIRAADAALTIAKKVEAAAQPAPVAG
jgi:hypothetical protein